MALVCDFLIAFVGGAIAGSAGMLRAIEGHKAEGLLIAVAGTVAAVGLGAAVGMLA